jgi:Spy/CpxP family protein refolding chaperone
MRHIVSLLLLLLGPALAAQQASDTNGGVPVQRLRQQIRQRWSAQVRRQLNLTETQAAQLQTTEERFFRQRREIQQRQWAVFRGLREQLQPGVAADPDSVRTLMDARVQNRAAMAQLERDEDEEMAAYLSPVQRARYQLMRQRLQERIAEMRRQRRGPMFGSEDRPQP